jgi:hypothetical protein
MGPNLARTFIDHYGGNIPDLYIALEDFVRSGDSFDPNIVLDDQIEDRIQQVIDENRDKSKSFQILRDLPVKGYHYINYHSHGETDPLIQSICLHGIAMLLGSDSSGRPDFPIDIWNFERGKLFSLETNNHFNFVCHSFYP